jgi:hypothetical protein
MPYFLIHFLGGGATSDPSGPGGRPWDRPLRLAVQHFCICGLLWVPGRPVSCPPVPLPRCVAGSLPDSHSGGGTGLGVGVGGGGMFGSLVRRLASRPLHGDVLHQLLGCHPAGVGGQVDPIAGQMLVPSTVVSSCKGDSSGPKNPLYI